MTNLIDVNHELSICTLKLKQGMIFKKKSHKGKPKQPNPSPYVPDQRTIIHTGGGRGWVGWEVKNDGRGIVRVCLN